MRRGASKPTLTESAMNGSQGVAGASAAATSKQSNATLENVAELAGRILLATLFLLSGIGKVGAYGATVAYMSSAGVPGALLPLVIATEVLGALAIIVGWKTRVAALLLAGFCFLTATIFHHNLADQQQLIHFFKDFAIAGGFLLLVAKGAGPLSIDRRMS
jgi:putative oxidoreductase